jgi:hypothetical protein
MVVWLVPSFTAAAISVSLIGVLLGPMFPIAINHVARVLPRQLVNGTVGWMSACGAGGSALFHLRLVQWLRIWELRVYNLCAYFFIDVLSFSKEINSISFFWDSLLAMMIILGTVWGFVPKKRKITC